MTGMWRPDSGAPQRQAAVGEVAAAEVAAVVEWGAAVAAVAAERGNRLCEEQSRSGFTTLQGQRQSHVHRKRLHNLRPCHPL